MDRDTCRFIREHLNRAVAPLNASLKMKVKVGVAKYDRAGSAVFKVEFAEIRSDGAAMTAEASALVSTWRFLGMPHQFADPLKTEFTHAYDRFRLVGYARRSRKYPILATRVSDGKPFKFAVDTVRNALARQVVTEGAASR